MRLKRERPPDAMHRRDRQARCLGHRPRAPMRRHGGHLLQRCRHHLGDLLVADLARRAGAWLVEKTIQREAANRFRQVATVGRVMPSRSAMAMLDRPLAASSTISARIASARAIFRRRVRASSSPRSASSNSIHCPASSPSHSATLRDCRPQQITDSETPMTRDFRNGTLAIRRQFYVPRKFGLRFSWNASTPSRKSSDWRSRL